ncbi:thioredoxin-dependent thiol peroxidase [Paenibacillus sp. GSMTC-2017]|uniref:thioredoxin-dependent thiol peroxidase n=1 Tax=Paenibacillus sp. GSMTC-2017 TaxID=2794350 RepID=UPI0018D82530|nr:thioredoxin-dependent thiol peroxidase [Paenibacillus sp. GSMTC-2017]MBH5318967.1 thioredoxin-dependent thiol peroxidase [Paenibacillus sp. GSMTC-2017]
MSLQLGKKAPKFKLPASNGEIISLMDLRGRNVVIFFYPKDMTPTCTEQACDMRDAYHQFNDENTVVLGISPDPIKSHLKFIEKKELPYLLLSDEGNKVCEQYGVWQMKKLYGREYMGIVRSTFLIDASGNLVREWRKVKVKGHAIEVLNAVKELKK